MTQEVARAIGRRRVEDLRRRSLFDDAACIEHGYPVADASRERDEGMTMVVATHEMSTMRDGATTIIPTSEGATNVFLLDADELLMPSRDTFERWIARVPPPYCAAIEWQTYLPRSMNHDRGAPIEAKWRRAEEVHGLYKIVLTRAFATTPAAVVGAGNHLVGMEGPDQNIEVNPTFGLNSVEGSARPNSMTSPVIDTNSRL